MARALTVRTVEAAKPDPQRRLELPDAGLSGLYLVVQPSGTKSWALRYRFAGKPAKLTLGRWPMMGLAAARAAAAAAMQRVEQGEDPALAKKTTKAARREAQLTERDKVKTLVAQFERRHLTGLRTGASVRRHFDRFILPVWGEREIRSITRRDVIDLLDDIVDSGLATTANRVKAYLSKFFNWCVERDLLEVAPTSGVRPPSKEVSRDRVLYDDEVRWFWQACEQAGQPWGSLGLLLLLTGQRRSEVAQMTEAEIRPGYVWHAPQRRGPDCSSACGFVPANPPLHHTQSGLSCAPSVEANRTLTSIRLSLGRSDPPTSPARSSDARGCHARRRCRPPCRGTRR
nr:DUF4102 domain-containing protein [Rubellimicrobium mesophilum]